MPLTASSLFRDSWNFLSHQLSRFIALAFIVAAIYFILLHIFVPDLTLVQAMMPAGYPNEALSPEQLMDHLNKQSSNDRQLLQRELIKTGLIILTPSMIGYALLSCATIAIVNSVQSNGVPNGLQLALQTVITLPKVLVLLYALLIISILGLSFFIVPGLLIAFGTTLAPIIMLSGRRPLFGAVRDSFRLSFRNFGIILQIILLLIGLNLLCSVVLSLLMVSLSLPTVMIIFTTAISNLVIIFMIVCFARFYMLTHQSLAN